MTEADALLELKDLCAAEAYPTLTESELLRILTKHRVFGVWTAGSAPGYGDKIVPTVRNGRLYRCVNPGQTDEKEPTWAVGYTRLVSDGEVQWVDCGPAPKEQWDLDTAAYDAWMKKASKVAGRFDTKDADQEMKRSQAHTQCLLQAATFGRQGVIG